MIFVAKQLPKRRWELSQTIHLSPILRWWCHRFQRLHVCQRFQRKQVPPNQEDTRKMRLQCFQESQLRARVRLLSVMCQDCIQIVDHITTILYNDFDHVTHVGKASETYLCTILSKFFTYVSQSRVTSMRSVATTSWGMMRVYLLNFKVLLFNKLRTFINSYFFIQFDFVKWMALNVLYCCC